MVVTYKRDEYVIITVRERINLDIRVLLLNGFFEVGKVCRIKVNEIKMFCACPKKSIMRKEHDRGLVRTLMSKYDRRGTPATGAPIKRAQLSKAKQLTQFLSTIRHR